MNKVGKVKTKSMLRLFLIVSTSFILLLPLGVAKAESPHLDHHIQHTDVISCAAACSTTLSIRVVERTKDVKSEFTQQIFDESSEFEQPNEGQTDPFVESRTVFLPDKSHTFRTDTALLL